ncbi:MULTISPECIES: hypothetical protein [Sorangium]|uniref:Membrane protein n=1 Tax=Sorangium cellulosum (strain So ce56) TaxID=448385 RepID=A9G2N9_SORC5|nr:hypothetical protein [Sorangium cellulosum]CAN95670.1 putative membrane protein [Sorangium cellulosum So ce56]
MTEPRRLLEESDNPLERALLSAGASYPTSPETRAKTLAALGLAGAAALSASVAAPAALSAAGGAATSSSLAVKLGWTKILVALSTVGMLAGIPAGYLAWRGQDAQDVAAAHRFGPALADPVVQTAARPAQAPAAAPAPVEALAEETMAPALAGGSSAAATKLDPKPSGTGAALEAELGALDAARTMLASGNARGALSLLDAYSRTHPRGRLSLEAEVLRIDALAKSGRSDAASQRAAAFLRRHPNSVLASRVRRYVNN